MIGLLTRSRRPARPAPRRPVVPSLEWLESRDCPSTLTLNVSYGSGKTITLSGDVSGGSCSPSLGGGLGVTNVVFRGSALGVTPVDGTGHFSYTTQALSLGEVDAVTSDGQSNTASVILSTSAPVVSNFKAVQEGNTNYWDISGHVTDGNFSAADLTVHITGAPATVDNNGAGRYAMVDSSGDFDLLVRLNGTGTDNGSIYAECTDAWGLESNDPSWTILQQNT